MPVYEDIKNYYKEKGKNTSKMSFKKWFEDELFVKFERDSNILKISHINEDKELILKTLNKISKKYQDYSKEIKYKDIVRSIEYLKNQKVILQKRSNDSRQKLNAFSIDNGLGSLDGFIKFEDSYGRAEDQILLNPNEGENNNFQNNLIFLNKIMQHLKDIENLFYY